MLAPIFIWELQRTMQQRWFHVARGCFSAIVFALFFWHLTEVTTIVAQPAFRRGLNLFLRHTSEFEHYLKASINSLIFLLTPILAAGPILQEKRQKTLELLLTTQQRSADIIVGHGLAALAKLLILISPVVPLLIWMHAFREETPMTWIIVWIGCTLLGALPLTAWSLLVAVYARQTATALLIGYAGNVLFVAALGMGFRDAQLAAWPHAVYDGDFWTYFAIIIIAPTVLCLMIAISQLRPAYAAAPERAVRAASHRPTLEVSDQPILWKQTHCNDVLMPRVVRWMPWWMRVALLIVFTIGVALIPDGTSAAWSLAVVVLAIPLVAIIWASTSIGSEREGGTWDSLRLTALSADEIVHETLKAITPRLRRYWFSLLPAIAVVACRDFTNLFVLLFWLVAGVSIYHATVAGLHASFHMESSWGGVLYAMATFASFFVLFGITSMFASMLGSLTILMCGCTLAVKHESNAVAIAALGIAATVATSVFLVALQFMFRARSDLLLVRSTTYLVQICGFEHRPSIISEAPIEPLKD